MFYSPAVPGNVASEPTSPRAFNLADLFEIVVDTVPDRTALVCPAQADGGVPDREIRRTYRELDERANRFGHHLLDHGVGAGDHVAVLAWNRAEWIEAELGIYKARASVINVNFRYRKATAPIAPQRMN
jgi:fatty-acyl-CoA synthase